MKVLRLKDRVIRILKPDSFLWLHCRLKEEVVWTSILQAEAARALGQRLWVAAHQDLSLILHHSRGMVLLLFLFLLPLGSGTEAEHAHKCCLFFSHFYRLPVFLMSKCHQLWLAFHVCQCKWGFPVKYCHRTRGFSLWFPWLSVNMPLLVCLPVRAAAPSTWSLACDKEVNSVVFEEDCAFPLPDLSRQSFSRFIFTCFICTFSYPVSVLFFFPGSFVTTLLFFSFSLPCCSRRKQMGREF